MQIEETSQYSEVARNIPFSMVFQKYPNTRLLYVFSNSGGGIRSCHIVCGTPNNNDDSMVKHAFLHAFLKAEFDPRQEAPEGHPAEEPIEIHCAGQLFVTTLDARMCIMIDDDSGTYTPKESNVLQMIKHIQPHMKDVAIVYLKTPENVYDADAFDNEIAQLKTMREENQRDGKKPVGRNQWETVLDFFQCVFRYQEISIQEKREMYFLLNSLRTKFLFNLYVTIMHPEAKPWVRAWCITCGGYDTMFHLNKDELLQHAKYVEILKQFVVD